jgi:hypothetical protein
VNIASSALRSRKVGASQENLELPEGESAGDKPSDQPEGLGSVGEPRELNLPSRQEVVSEQSTKGPSFDDSGEIKQTLAGIMTVVQQSNAKLQESVKADIDRVRKDIKAENEKLIKRFELQSQEAKLDSEARRLTNLVGQVQRKTESKPLVVKGQIQVVSTELETRIGQSNANTQGIIDELASQIVDHRSEMDAN